jgi:arginyl-tRNA synthetase
VKFHDEVEKDVALEDEGRAAFKKLEQGDKKLQAFWKAVVDITMASMEEIYERLHVSFTHTQGESFYEDKMTSIIEEGKKKGVFKSGKEGALIAEFPEGSNMPPAIALKADGSTIYLTRDLATARYRIDTWHPQAILYVVDIAQQLYFKQLFAVLGQLGWELPKLEHVLFGRMSFAYKAMSTRKGNILRLEAVLDEAVKRATALIKERGEKIQTDDPNGLAEIMGVGSVVYGAPSLCITHF